MVEICEANATFPPVLLDYCICVDGPLSSESQNRCWSFRLACSYYGRLAEPLQEVPSDTAFYFFPPTDRRERELSLKFKQGTRYLHLYSIPSTFLCEVLGPKMSKKDEKKLTA